MMNLHVAKISCTLSIFHTWSHDITKIPGLKPKKEKKVLKNFQTVVTNKRKLQQTLNFVYKN